MGNAVAGGGACERTPPDPLDGGARSRTAGSRSEIGERIRSWAEVSLGTIERYAHHLFDRDLTAEEAAGLVDAAENLAVLFGRLELPKIARLARDLATLFSGVGPWGVTTGVRVAATCDDLRALIDSAIAQHSAVGSSADVVLVLGDAIDAVDVVCWTTQTRGYSVIRAVHELPLLDRDPAAVIAVCPSRFTPAVASVLRAVTEQWDAPLLIVHDHADRSATQQLAAFATTVLPPESSPGDIAAELTRTIAAYRQEPRVFLCDRSLATAERFFANGFGVIHVADGDPLPDSLGPLPGVVVFGPSVGPEAVEATSRLVRATPGRRHDPIVWVTGTPQSGNRPWIDRLDVQTVEAIDDALISRCAGRLRRLAADYSDVVKERTSILSWAATQVLIDRILVVAHRSGGHVAVASIRIHESVPWQRIAVLKEALGTEFRRDDVLGLRGDRTIVVALDGVPGSVAGGRLASLLDRLDLDSAAVRVGVAHFPSDGRSAIELVTAADQAAALAVEHTGPAVVTTNWRPDADDVVDALVVDGDPVLGHLLVELMAESGLRAKQFNTGPDLLATLSQQGDSALPRLLLLDLDVPGIDGIALLRKLRTAGLIAQIKIVLMISRSSESDLRVALDIGVVDIIRKPFPATLLRHRLRLVLGEMP